MLDKCLKFLLEPMGLIHIFSTQNSTFQGLTMCRDSAVHVKGSEVTPSSLNHTSSKIHEWRGIFFRKSRIRIFLEKVVFWYSPPWIWRKMGLILMSSVLPLRKGFILDWRISILLRKRRLFWAEKSVFCHKKGVIFKVERTRMGTTFSSEWGSWEVTVLAYLTRAKLSKSTLTFRTWWTQEIVELIAPKKITQIKIDKYGKTEEKDILVYGQKISMAKIHMAEAKR